MVAVAAFVLLSNASNYTIDNVRSAAAAFDDEWLREFFNILICPEIVLVFALKERVVRAERKKRNHFVFGFFCVQAALFAMFALLEEAAFGALRGLLDYPLHALASVAEFSVVRRLDALFIAVWLAAQTLRTAAFIIGAMLITGTENESAAPAVGISAAIFLTALAALSAEGAGGGELRALTCVAFIAVLTCFAVGTTLNRARENRSSQGE